MSNNPMTNLIWTNERPKTVGFYWLRETPIASGEVVTITLFDGKPLYWDSNREYFREPEPLNQWAGPIPEPTEAAQPHYIDRAVKTDLNTKL